MKGLVIKDLLCMKKQIVIFTYTVITVFIVAIMFVLSAKFGNIALANNEMLQDNSISEIDIQNMMIWTLIGVMLVPIAAIGDFTNLFKADNKAGFSMVSASLPLSREKRLFAKYITVILVFSIGIVIDLIVAFVLSMLTDMVSFFDFCGIILSMASIMMMVGALSIFFALLLEKGEEEYATLLSAFFLIIVAVLFNYSKIKMFILEDGSSDMFNDFVDFFIDKSYVFIIFAVITIVLSYVASLAVANRKRGII